MSAPSTPPTGLPLGSIAAVETMACASPEFFRNAVTFGLERNMPRACPAALVSSTMTKPATAAGAGVGPGCGPGSGCGCGPGAGGTGTGTGAGCGLALQPPWQPARQAESAT